MKIVHLCTQDDGGAGNAAYLISKGLNALGVDSKLIVLNKSRPDNQVLAIPDDYSAKRELLNLTHSSMIAQRMWHRFFSKMHSFQNRPKDLEIFTTPESEIDISQIKEILNADVINLHWVAGMIDFEKVVRLFRDKIVVWTLHDMNPFTGGCHYNDMCENFISECGACPQIGSNLKHDIAYEIFNYKKQFYDKVNLTVVTPSNWLANEVKKSKLFGKYRTEVIHNGFDLTIFKPYNNTETKNTLNIPLSAKIILFGASYSNKRKGFNYLIQALKKIEASPISNQVYLLAFGNIGDFAAEFNKIRLISLGNVANPIVLAKIYSVADVFVIPSIEDNLPSVVIESIACGTPVVGFKIGGVPDMVEHKINGYLAESKNINDLVNGISWVLNSNLKELRKNSRQTAETKFELINQSKKYLSLYKSLKSELQKKQTYFSYSVISKNSDKNTKISIVTPSFNQGEYLEQSIDSVLSQKYDNLEYIIMDGGSSDNSVEIIRKYEKHLAFWISKPDNGQYWAINEGFRHTTGEVMTWLNSDDIFLRDAFKIVNDIFNNYSNINWITGKPIVIDKDGNVLYKFDETPLWSREKYLTKKHMNPCIQQEGTFWKKDLWNRAGGYLSSSYSYAGDLELWTRLFRFSHLHSVNYYLACFRQHEEQKSSSIAKYLNEADVILNNEIAYYKREPLEALSPPPPLIELSYTQDISYLYKKLTVENDFERLLISINRLVQTGDLLKAKTLIENYLVLKPNHVDALITLALIKKSNKNYQEAIEIFKKILSVDSQNEIALKNIADLERVKVDNVHTPHEIEAMVDSVSINYQPLVSAIVSTYNAEKFFKGCLENLVDQTLFKKGLLEIIVIDSCSQQNEEKIFKEFFSKYQNIAYVRTEKREGVYAAWNRGIKISKGKYITNANTDDRHRVDALEVMAYELELNPDISLVYADTIRTNTENQTYLNHTPTGKFYMPEFDRYLLLDRCYIGPQPMWRKELHTKYGYFDVSFQVAGDYEFWLRIAPTEEFKHIREFLGLYLKNPDSVEHRNSQLSFNETIKAKELHQNKYLSNTLKQKEKLKLSLLKKPKRQHVKIGLVLISLNDSDKLKECLDSLFNTDLNDYDITFVIMDDGSTDPRNEAIINTKRNSKYKIYRFFSQRSLNNVGLSINKAVRTLLEIDDFDIIGWAFSDTLFYPEWLEQTMKTALWAKENHNSELLGPFSICSSKSSITTDSFTEHTSPYGKYLVTDKFMRQNCFFFRDDFIKIGAFDEKRDPNEYMSNRLTSLGVNAFYIVLNLNKRFEKKDDRVVNLISKIYSDKPSKIPQKNEIPLVSAIVSTYNSEFFIEECLKDLINQSLFSKGLLEIVVIDSGSEQNEGSIVKKYTENYSNIIYHRTQERESIYAAWNRGIKISSGKYITNANTDDRHQEKALETLALELENNPDFGLIYADQYITEYPNQTYDNHIPVGYFEWPDFDPIQLIHCSCCGPQPLWRKDLHEKYGYFDESLIVAGDYEWWLRLSDKVKFLHLKKKIGLYLLSDSSVEHKYNEETINETKKLRIQYANKYGLKNLDYNRYKSTFISLYSSINPVFSVIIPTYNRPRYLQEAIESVLEQDFPYFEIIVVNDAGQNVSKIVSNYKDKRIKYFNHNKNKGLAASRNTGIRNSKGLYIAFLDDDDIFYPDHLSTIIKELNNCSDVVYTNAVRSTYKKYNGKHVLIRKSIPYSIDYDKNKLLFGNITPVNCIGVKKLLLEQIGGFNEEFFALEDWDLLQRLSEISDFSHIKKETCEVRWEIDGKSLTLTHQDKFSKPRNIIYSRNKEKIEKVRNKEEIIAEFQSIWQKDSQKFDYIVSIITLSYNQVKYTKEFVESVFEHTKIEFELIIIDNGSNEETKEYLFAIEKSKKNVKVIFNKHNLGFPKAVNQGIIKSQGEYILLANNDIVVTDGWLEKLVAGINMHFDYGIAGPMSNLVSGEQLDKNAKYHNMKEMHKYAKTVERRNKGKYFEFPRVAFLCTLIKREVIEKIGGLDTIFSPGNFEDDDFCLRAQLAGYRTIILKDVFIHHYGSKSFMAEGEAKYLELGKKNLRKFIEKWGADPEDIWLHSKPFKKFSNLFIPLGENMLKEQFDLIAKLIDDKEYYQALDSIKALLNEMPENEMPENEMTSVSFKKEDILNMAGNLAFILNDYLESQKYFEMQLNLNPTSADACFGLGECFFAMEQFDQASTMYNEALKIDPNHNASQHGLDKLRETLGETVRDYSYLSNNERLELAEDFMQKGNYEEAIDIITQLLQENPQNIDALNDAAVICILINKFDSAVEFINAVLQIDPGNDIALENLNILEENLDAAISKQKAEQQPAFQHPPVTLSPSLSKGVELINTMQFDEARKVLMPLISSPERKDVIVNLAKVEFFSGNYMLAKTYCTQVLAMDPDNNEAFELLSTIRKM